ncbi:MAG TPA: DnaJ domain-containing protein [Polyangiaceae bacterium]|jgi:curved DNA-binding protein CbpA|nr:DnaJ domain-containing protein [Polyangiaceae bacterium]
MVAQRATGTLGGTPIANLLVYTLDRRLSGTLVLEDPGQQKSAILFQRGVPVKVKLAEPFALLSELAIESGAVDEAHATSSFEASRAEERLHGEALVAEGLIEPGTLADLLVEQIARKIERLCELPPETHFGYYDEQDFLQAYGSPESVVIEPLGVIWRAVRLQAEGATVDATLARLGGRDARLHPRSRVSRFGFTPRERGIVDVLRGKPQSVPSLVQTGILPERELKKVLYALVITRHLDLGSGALPIGIDMPSIAPPAPDAGERARAMAATPQPQPSLPSPPARAAPAATPARSPELLAFRQEIRDRAAKIGSLNYYQILGIAQDAPMNAIQSAFFQLAKQWHPDRLSPELGDLRDLTMRIFSRMSEAHQVLTNEEQRGEYERLMREGGAAPDEQDMVQRVLRAATAFQKAEVLARRGNLAEAEKHAELAVENDPEQAEYTALYADLLSQKPERTQSGNYEDVLKMVNDARRTQPDNLKVRLYRARVLKRSGDADAAHREFRGIVEQDVHNVEAAREVRLHEMRRGGRATDPKKTGDNRRNTVKPAGKGGKNPPAEAGLFGKLFKR